MNFKTSVQNFITAMNVETEDELGFDAMPSAEFTQLLHITVNKPLFTAPLLNNELDEHELAMAA